MNTTPSHRVELIDISKSFGGNHALKQVTLKVKAGEIHALIGENGAGKSTLMKVLSGAHQKDSGEIYIDGKRVIIKNPHDSKRLGIGIIYQEFSLAPDLSVAENVCLQSLYEKGSWMKWRAIKEKTARLIDEMGFQINPMAKVSSLSVAQQQLVEIAKALSENVKILILDEPSSVLGPNETEKLFKILHRLKQNGIAIIYISHHLDEIFRLADRVTVLKDGSSSQSMLISEVDKDGIIKLMLGRSLHTMYPAREAAIGAEVLRVENIGVNAKVKDVSFSVKAGEVIGLAGLVGSGRTEVVRALFAADKKTQGETYLHGKPISFKSPYSAVRAGIGLVPEDRKQQGVILSLPVKQNISLTDFKNIANRLGFVKTGKEKAKTSALIQKLAIKPKNENLKVDKLSGGNQQKVALAKWLGRDCQVIIIDEPTRGVDVGAKIEIYHLINELSHKGLGIIVVSSEISELLGICDRILVMHEGQAQGELEKKDFSEENILRLAIGQ